MSIFGTGYGAKLIYLMLVEAVMMTNYNKATHEPCASERNGIPIRDDQEEITIDGYTFYANKCMISLLKAMNEIGLKTYSHHGGGSGDNDAGLCWLVIELDNAQVEMRPHQDPNTKRTRPQMVLTWQPDVSQQHE